MTHTPHDELVQIARRRTRAHTRGVLLPDQHPAAGHIPAFEARVVIDPLGGDVVMPMPVEALAASHGMLCLPSERADCVALSMSWQAQTEDQLGVMVDRWTAYHGKADRSTWALARVESIRSEGQVFDRDEVPLASSVNSEAPAMRRMLNANRSALARIVRDRCNMEAESPLVVGVDDWGIDVQSGFGVLRLEFPTRADETTLHSLVQEMLRAAGD